MRFPTDTHLSRVLESETLTMDSPELRALLGWQEEVERRLREHFRDSAPWIRPAGSLARGTAIRSDHDAGLACCFACDETRAGITLEDLFEHCRRLLARHADVEVRAPVLRVRPKSCAHADPALPRPYVDVVPSRYVDDASEDVLIRGAGEDRIRTSIVEQVEFIRASRVPDALRLVRLWRARHALALPGFVLELLVIGLLEGRESLPLDEQLRHVWSELRDHADALTVRDPATPLRNDLTPLLAPFRAALARAATTTLAALREQGWESVFGPLPQPVSARSPSRPRVVMQRAVRERPASARIRGVLQRLGLAFRRSYRVAG